MVDSRTEFNARLRTLGRKHRAMAKGVTQQVRKDGLIVVRPTRRRTRRFFPLKGLILLVLGFFAFKGFLLASLGEAAYQDRLTKLEAGTALEQVGAAAMRPEPVSMVFEDVWANVLRD